MRDDALAAPTRPLWFLRILIAFLGKELTVVSRYRLAFLVRFFTFGAAVVSLYFFSRFVGTAPNAHLARYGGDYLGFGVVGLLAAELQQVGLSALAQRVRVGIMFGQLEAQLATPAPTWMVLAAAPVYELGAAALRSAAYLLGANLLLGVSFGQARLDSLLLAAPLVLAAFGGLALITAGATILVRRTNPVAAVLGAASFFLSGVLYPVSVLPDWLQGAGRLLPLTHAIEALRQALLVGAAPRQMAGSLGALALFAVLFVPLGLGLFTHALRRARIDGNLTHE